MNATLLPKADPKRDLVLDRVVDVPHELVWTVWTTPEHLVKWYVPRPWTVAECEIDLRPGGIFRTVMRSPEGEDFENVCCYLDIRRNQRLVWTDALHPGYRPAFKPLASGPAAFFTAVLTLLPQGQKTRYVATVMHRDEADRKRHEELGFHDGWGTVLDQLVEYAKTM